MDQATHNKIVSFIWGIADDNLLPHLSPLGWEHINLNGDRTSKSSRATSGPYSRSIGLSVRFLPFREVTP